MNQPFITRLCLFLGVLSLLGISANSYKNRIIENQSTSPIAGERYQNWQTGGFSAASRFIDPPQLPDPKTEPLAPNEIQGFELATHVVFQSFINGNWDLYAISLDMRSSIAQLVVGDAANDTAPRLNLKFEPVGVRL